MSTYTNILAIPHATMIIETGNNEDWIESLCYLVPNGTNNPATYPQLDLRGITFEMSVRHEAKNHEVVLTASTMNGMIKIPAYPNYGFLLLYIPVDIMEQQSPGDYVGDIVASDFELTHRIVTFDLNIIDGVTRYRST